MNGAGTGMEAFRLLPMPPARLLALSASDAAVLVTTKRSSAPCLSGASGTRTTVTTTMVSVLCVRRSRRVIPPTTFSHSRGRRGNPPV